MVLRHTFLYTAILLQLFFAKPFVFAQEGNPFLTHYQIPGGISNQNWGFTQGDNGLMFILNRKGIYSFDGSQWENLGISGRPISIAFSNELFYCTDEGVGYFAKEIDGTYRQHLIISSDSINLFYDFTKVIDGLLVVSPQTICKISTNDQISVDTLYHENRPEVFISDFFQLNGQMYHVKNRALIYLNKTDGSYEMLAGLPIGEDMEFSFIHGEHAFFGSSSSVLYRFDGRSLKPFKIRDQEYINASILNGGISATDSTFVISTLNGGCLVINSNSGETVNTLNYFSGLPDDEIFSLGTDRDGGLWISHSMGISRADFNAPISSFGFYEGKSGYILSCIVHDNKIYLGTSEGLFYLNEVHDYKAVDVVVRRKSKPESKRDEITRSDDINVTQTVEQKKKNFISRLFSRKSEDNIKNEADSKTNLVSSDQSRELQTIKKRIYQLQSVSHKYKKVEGIQGKVKQLLKYQGCLFAATNFGLYEIQGSKPKLIVPNKNIVFVQESSFNPNQLLLGSYSGAFLAKKVRGSWSLEPLFEQQNSFIVSIVELEERSYIVSTEFDVLLVSKDQSSKPIYKRIDLPGTEKSLPIVREINGDIYAFTSMGLFVYNSKSNEFSLDTDYHYSSGYSIIYNQKDFTWVASQKEWSLMLLNGNRISNASSYLNLFDDINYIYVSADSSLFVINRFSNVYRINPNAIDTEQQPLSIFIKRIVGLEGKLLNPEDIELDYSNNSIRIRISAPSYMKEESIEYQYYITGLMNDWSEWISDPNLSFPYFSPGKYVISIRAKDVLGNISEVVNVQIRIRPPFWQTIWFILVCILFFALLMVLVVKYRERSLRREKEILEHKVKERTKTIEKQNLELTKQRDELERYNKEILQQKEEIESQRDEIEKQRDQIYKQNEEITQSITYARKIQSAVMPSVDVINQMLGDYFIMFRPRDIVSGDFYWMTEHNNRIVVVAADCTGHGVPGAFMSMMGVSFLNDIVNVDGQTQPDKILNTLREKIKSTLYQIGKDGETRDGMDISVCVFLKNTRTLMFAGAYNPLYITRKGELIEHKADKMPVGVHPKEKELFTLHNIKLEADDNLYIFSDGYVSQFGGPDGRKFMAKPFKDLITSIHGKPMNEQRAILEDTMDRWQAAHDQVDDILVIGIAVK